MRKLFRFLCLTSFLSLVIFGTSLPAFAHQYVKSQPPSFRHVCSKTSVGTAHCDAIQLMTFSTGVTPNASAPSGFNPSDLQSAYNLPSSSAGSGQTVAIVAAYDDPNAESDLAAYRTQFGQPICTTANGCFQKVNQIGGSTPPAADVNWSVEISTDLDMVSAICPNCHILLVEASSDSSDSLGTAVNTAVSLGANTVSNSYGSSEDSSETSYASYYNHPGVVITASSGDNSYGVEVPAAYNTVVAVGGTSLSRNSTTRGWSETAWSGAGSGCSAYISKPSWQRDTGCSGRTVADVSAVVDPNTGVSVYDSYQNSGWLVLGGTSATSPIIASIYALAGNARSINAASSLYSHSANLNDVTSGSNGSCGGSYLCTAGPGYDGPTGLGTPNGTTAFSASLPGMWPQCAGENGTCSFTGTMTVAYGANGKFNYATLTNGTACTNGVFGDPIVGTVKACYMEAIPPTTNVWSQCAGENGTCSFTGTMTVAYGANGKFNYATLTNGTACSNTVFGDPIYGTVKACYIVAPPANTVAWTWCAGENGTCSFTGTHEVAYGANGQFFYRNLTNGTACSYTVFGDPIYGTVKSCYYQ